MLKLRSWMVAGCAVALLAACDKPAESAKATETEEVAELTPRQRVATYQAQFGVINALMTGSMTALQKVDNSEPTTPMPASLAGPESKQLTVFFASNNHGEREDCGCKRNPLGGLARRHTLLNLLRDGEPAEVAKWWEGKAPAEGPVFHVDAGDGFYMNSTINRGTPNAKKIAKHDARAVIDALNMFPPDAYLVGELDAAFGAEDLAANAKRAKFPLVSANLRKPGGETLFPGHVVVERDGRKVGIVGITKQKTRYASYWTEQGLEVADPFESARDEIAKLPTDVDLVVLLSNLGLNDTQTLVTKLEEAGSRVDLGVVSGTNRLTNDPEFASGTPLVEPLSQGKYLGRADFVLNGDEVEYLNAGSVSRTQRADYRRALRNYHTSRKQLLRDQQKLAELEMAAETIDTRSDGTPKAAEAAEELKKRREDGFRAQNKRIETSESRLQTVSEALLATLRPLNAPQKVSGDDWIDAQVVPVKIEVPEEKKTRQVLDRAARTRPAEEHAAALPPSIQKNSLKKQLPGSKLSGGKVGPMGRKKLLQPKE